MTKRPQYYALTPEVILNAGKEISDELSQAMYFFIYLTGCRVSEAKDFSINRISYMDGYVRIEMKVLKTRDESKMWRRALIPLEIDKCHEFEMWEFVKGYIKGFGSFDRPFTKWGNMSEYLKRHIVLVCEAKKKGMDGIWRDGKIEKPFHPHYLRICRATHLCEYYQFDSNDLCRFFGWSDPKMALRYTSQADVKQAFIKSKS